ncbi:hypothetical protein GGC65_001031 [Sphingopyxis sp. OAS728]|uniref:MAE_28990/MAE_18760 family HEPN-like nuclease n=1 Tax=Sphingopyxis sp. OAS728 TaxID=2663823 RepID=UPI00178B985B|nr:MAE_28990/MAE_18760 family HEPN-like nuclease [Sphingopyxis sp. OAS728]MBE1526575.1 hypothetical protein [Sphingopyxis sp. OAS728]
MYNPFLERTKSAISALIKHVHTSENFRTALLDNALRCAAETPCFDLGIGAEQAPDRVAWRVIDHCAVVTRIYAIYEQFCSEMIREHLGLLQSRIPFSQLPDEIKASYRLGISKILEKKDGPRFGDIDLNRLVEGYHAALSDSKYTIEPRAMLMQEQNLRLPELQRYMKSCGIENMSSWIEKHRAVLAFFETGDRLTASAESELSEIIKYRNDAAHGSLDISDILHVNVLVEFCEFISALCEAISERVQLSGLLLLKDKGFVEKRGKLTESLRDGTVFIGKMTGGFEIGGTVYLCGESYCVERMVTSLQIEGQPHDRVLLEEAAELGMMFDIPAKKNVVLFRFNEAPPVPEQLVVAQMADESPTAEV